MKNRRRRLAKWRRRLGIVRGLRAHLYNQRRRDLMFFKRHNIVLEFRVLRQVA